MGLQNIKNSSSSSNSNSNNKLKIEILSIRSWQMNAQVAESFDDYHINHVHNVNSVDSVDNNNHNTHTINKEKEKETLSPKIFLVGDSAHQFPPAGGFGMNTVRAYEMYVLYMYVNVLYIYIYM